MGASGEENNGVQEGSKGGVQELELHDAESDEPVVEDNEEKMTVLSTTRGSAARFREVMSFPTLCLVTVAAFLTGSAITVVCIGCSRSRNFGASGFTRRKSEYQSLRVASQSCNDMDSINVPTVASVASAVSLGYTRNNSRGLSASSHMEDCMPRNSSRLGSSPQEAGGAWTRIEVQDPI